MANQNLIKTLATTVVQVAQKKAPIKTGTLKRSIKTLSLKDDEAVIGHEYEPVTVASHGEKIIYPVFVHEGTAAYEIYPKEKKALSFTKNGMKVIRRKVSHPGIKKQPYFDEALKSPKIDRVLSAYGDEIVNELAMKIEKGWRK